MEQQGRQRGDAGDQRQDAEREEERGVVNGSACYMLLIAR
jgi:hypothetical protein